MIQSARASHRSPTPDDFEFDLAAVQGIDAVPGILDVICRMTGMGFAAVARVTDERWVALAVRDLINFGLAPGGELKVETTICSEIRDAGAPVVIDNVAENEHYCGHPTPKMYGFQSYISVPILLKDGSFFGTLCAIDPQPRTLNTPEMLGMFTLFAQLIALQLDLTEQVITGHAALSATRATLAASEASLLDAQKTAQLREEFIAVLGHDLRNPLASLDAGISMLLKREDNAPKRDLMNLMRGSVMRMAGLIDNLLDFARGRLGGGFALTRNSDEPLGPALEQIVSEFRNSYPGRTIKAQIDIPEELDCDRRRIGQVLSNLLGNALNHGAADTPVGVQASIAGGTFELTVSNAGSPIPESAMAQLFQPFFRGGASPIQQGLGLGLYIASEIARAHHGTLTVDSTAEETRFTFRMPLRVPA